MRARNSSTTFGAARWRYRRAPTRDRATTRCAPRWRPAARCGTALFGATVAAGSHGKAIERVRTGQADMASIDCVTLALWQRSNPELAQHIRVFERTQPYPGLPLVTGLGTPPAAIAALRAGLARGGPGPAFCSGSFGRRRRCADLFPWNSRNYAPCLQMRAQAAARGIDAL